MANKKQVIGSPDLQAFFHRAVSEARSDLGIQLSEVLEFYVVNLLCAFACVERAPRVGGEPLALMYQRAMAANASERALIYKQLGDVALYVSGFFGEFIESSLVDIDYYVSMGGGAYHRLSSLVAARRRGTVFAGLYGQLAVRFTELVDILNQVSERAREGNSKNEDLLRLYDRWVRTGSARSRRILAERGVLPSAGIPLDYDQ